MSSAPAASLGIPPLLSLADIAYLLEGQVQKQTVYTWNITRVGRPRVMPDPDWSFGVTLPTPMWRQEVVLEVLASRGYTIDQKRLGEIRKAQGHPPK